MSEARRMRGRGRRGMARIRSLRVAMKAKEVDERRRPLLVGGGGQMMSVLQVDAVVFAEIASVSFVALFFISFFVIFCFKIISVKIIIFLIVLVAIILRTEEVCPNDI
jgi:hypothetical protein